MYLNYQSEKNGESGKNIGNWEMFRKKIVGYDEFVQWEQERTKASQRIM